MLLFLFPLAHATCTAPTEIRAVTDPVSAAHLAIAVSLDTKGFLAEVAKARDALPCLGTELMPVDAAAYHGLMALDAAYAGNPDEGRRAFSSALAAMPTFRLHTGVAPEGGPISALIEEARTLPPGETQALPPYDGVVMVDGVRALVRPTWRPCILQLVDPRGAVERTYYLLGTDPLPRWDPPPTAIQRFIPQVREKPSVPFGIAAGTTAVAAGTLYALGNGWHTSFEDPATPYEDLEGLQAQSNGALAGSIGLAVLAAAFTTVTIVKW